MRTRKQGCKERKTRFHYNRINQVKALPKNKCNILDVRCCPLPSCGLVNQTLQKILTTHCTKKLTKVKRTLKAKLTLFIMPSKGPEGLYMTQI